MLRKHDWDSGDSAGQGSNNCLSSGLRPTGPCRSNATSGRVVAPRRQAPPATCYVPVVLRARVTCLSLYPGVTSCMGRSYRGIGHFGKSRRLGRLPPSPARASHTLARAVRLSSPRPAEHPAEILGIGHPAGDYLHEPPHQFRMPAERPNRAPQAERREE